jgi:hypothetical protein
MAYAASRPKKVKRRVRKGIPDEFRGLAWQYLSGGFGMLLQMSAAPVTKLGTSEGASLTSSGRCCGSNCWVGLHQKTRWCYSCYNCMST